MHLQRFEEAFEAAQGRGSVTDVCQRRITASDPDYHAATGLGLQGRHGAGQHRRVPRHRIRDPVASFSVLVADEHSVSCTMTSGARFCESGTKMPSQPSLSAIAASPAVTPVRGRTNVHISGTRPLKVEAVGTSSSSAGPATFDTTATQRWRPGSISCTVIVRDRSDSRGYRSRVPWLGVNT